LIANHYTIEDVKKSKYLQSDINFDLRFKINDIRYTIYEVKQIE